MRTEDLIDSLSADTRRVSHHAAERRLALGLLIGGAATLALLVNTIGLRPDLSRAVLTAPFFMKAAYTISLAVIAVLAVANAARPDSSPFRGRWLVAVPVLVLAMLSGYELVTTPSAHWFTMMMGKSWRQCSVNVGMLSLPVFIGLLWAFRRLAPTRLVAAGAAAGLASGAVAATLYGLHCSEVAATFVITWYSVGIATATAVGALLGPRLLRW